MTGRMSAGEADELGPRVGLPGEPFASRPRLALRDLQLLDGALAEAARWAGVPVTDLDTVRR